MTIDTLAEKSYCCCVRSSKTRMILRALGIAALLLLLSACGSTGANPSTTTTTTTTTTGSGPTMRVSTGGLAWGVVGVSYSASLSAAGGTSPYSWQITSGSLPSG